MVGFLFHKLHCKESSHLFHIVDDFSKLLTSRLFGVKIQSQAFVLLLGAFKGLPECYYRILMETGAGITMIWYTGRIYLTMHFSENYTMG